MIQRENDELHETLGRKQQVNETLRSDFETLQKQFDTLTIQKTELQTRLQQSLDEIQSIKEQLSQAAHTDPQFLQGEIIRLTKALESKTRDFDFVAARYQEAGAAANESSNAVIELKAEVEKLTTRLEMDVKAVTWEGQKKVLLDRIKELEGKCKLLEEREQRIQRKEGSGASE
jgi:predicted  nucleic acid-binding Zn-ribbon protein